MKPEGNVKVPKDRNQRKAANHHVWGTGTTEYFTSGDLFTITRLTNCVSFFADDVFADVTDPSWMARLSLPLTTDYHDNVFVPNGPPSPDSELSPRDPLESSSFSTFGKLQKTFDLMLLDWINNHSTFTYIFSSSLQVKRQRRTAHWGALSCPRSARCLRCWWRRRPTPTPALGPTSCTGSLQHTDARWAWTPTPRPPPATHRGTLGTQTRGGVQLRPQDFTNKLVSLTLEKDWPQSRKWQEMFLFVGILEALYEKKTKYDLNELYCK